jgi:hypothetical protein
MEQTGLALRWRRVRLGPVSDNAAMSWVPMPAAFS